MAGTQRVSPNTLNIRLGELETQRRPRTYFCHK